MSKVIKLDSNEWTTSEDFVISMPFGISLQFAGSPIVFNVDVSMMSYDPNEDPICKINVVAEPNPSISQMSYLIECDVCCPDGEVATGIVNETVTTAVLFAHEEEVMFVKLTLKNVASFCAVNADLNTYIERGPTVTLVGSDGTVAVSKRLIEIWSEALEVMFNHDSQEKRTGQIKMEDFDAKTLTAFKQFLMTGVIENGKETALGLILLADKYDVQVMKKAAEEYVKKNIRKMDKEEVLDIFSKVSRGTLTDAMIGFWSKK